MLEDGAVRMTTKRVVLQTWRGEDGAVNCTTALIRRTRNLRFSRNRRNWNLSLI